MKNQLSKFAAAAALAFLSSAYADGMPKDDAAVHPDASAAPVAAAEAPHVAPVMSSAGIADRAVQAGEGSYTPPEKLFAGTGDGFAPKPEDFQSDLVRVVDHNDPATRVQTPANDALFAYVPPERTVQVTISRRDVNRIHCPVEVADVFYSKEKPVNVTVAGSDVWVKVLKKVVGGTHESYDKDPVDLHIVCADSVYTMILLPSDIDSVTLRLGQPTRDKASAIAKEWGALPIEEKVQRLTRMVYRDELPVTFQKQWMTSDRRTPRMFRNMIVQGKQRVTAPGLGLSAMEYEVIPNQLPLQLDERDFLNIGLSKTIVGITVDPLVLDDKHRKARLIVIERSLSDGR